MDDFFPFAGIPHQTTLFRNNLADPLRLLGSQRPFFDSFQSTAHFCSVIRIFPEPAHAPADLYRPFGIFGETNFKTTGDPSPIRFAKFFGTISQDAVASSEFDRRRVLSVIPPHALPL